jgi:hypothetical protein
VTAGSVRRAGGSCHASATKPNVRSNTHMGLSRIGGARQGYVRTFILGSAQVLALLITGPHIEVSAARNARIAWTPPKGLWLYSRPPP